LWRLPTLPGLTQVSSAVPGLTSLFGMGRGEHRANSHQQAFLLICGMGKGEANVAPDHSNSHQQAFLLVMINNFFECILYECSKSMSYWKQKRRRVKIA
jgi:hypothetical protein